MEKILCFGDSNTYGYEPAGPFGDRLPEEQIWTAILEVRAGKHVINEGMNGRPVPRNVRAAEIEWNCLRHHMPCDRMIIMLGSNDLLFPPYLTAEETGERMEAFLRFLQAEQPGMPILLIAPPALQGLPESICMESRKLGAVYRNIADRLHVDFADASEWNIPPDWDGVHFLPAGHRRFAEEVEKCL